MYNFDGKMYCDCEKCGGLAVVDDSIVYASIPPKHSYRCPSCDYKGYVDCTKVFCSEYRIGERKDNAEFYKELQAEQQEQM